MGAKLDREQWGSTEIIITEFRGTFPKLELPEDIDLTAFGENKWFATLKIGKVGATSHSGRVYTRTAMEQLVEQVNKGRPEGRWGHLKEEDRATVYDPPAVRWLAAMIDEDGTVWAKCYPMTAEAKEHLRIAAATNAKVGTSIYGKASMEGSNVIGLNVETIDLAGAPRVGVPETAAHVQITSEQSDKESGMADTDLKDLIAERDSLKARIAELENELKTLKPAEAALASAGEMVGNKDIAVGIKTLQTEKEGLIAENKELLKEAIANKVSSVKLESARPIIAELISAANPTSRKQLDEVFTEVMARESVKTLLKQTVIKEMGPRQSTPTTPPSSGSEGWKSLVDIPEEKETA